LTLFNRETVGTLRSRYLRGLRDTHLLLVILLGFGIAKVFFYNPVPVGDYRFDDGNFYYQVARHVAEGDGLVTSVSAQGLGLKHLPAAYTAYPLWPLVLGGSGAVFGLKTSTVLLPEVLFFVDLLLIYLLGDAMAGSWSAPRSIDFPAPPLVHLGHLAVLLLGGNQVFFKFTSFPFTEGLAMALVLGTILVTGLASRGRSVRWGIAAGLLASFAYLTRYQMVGVMLAVPIALGVAAVQDRYLLRAAVAAGLASIGIVALWFTWLTSVYGVADPRLLVDPTAVVFTPTLEKYSWLVVPPTSLGFLKDRLQGVLVAFNPNHSFSYIASFGMVVYTIPLAAIMFLFMRRRSSPGGRWERSGHSGRGLVSLTTVLVGLACLAPVHMLHSNRFGGWFFQFRHGIPIILLVIAAIGYLGSRKSVSVRVVTFLLVLSSLWTEALATRAELYRDRDFAGPTVAHRELRAWIEGQDPQPVFATVHGYALGALTRGLFHVVECDESSEQMQVYVDRVGVDHLVARGSERDCGFVRNLSDRIEQVVQFGEGKAELVVWRVVR